MTVVYFTTLSMCTLYSVEWEDEWGIMNLKGFGRKRLWPDWSTITAFAWKDRKTTKILSENIWFPAKCLQQGKQSSVNLVTEHIADNEIRMFVIDGKVSRNMVWRAVLQQSRTRPIGLICFWELVSSLGLCLQRNTIKHRYTPRSYCYPNLWFRNSTGQSSC
jgi:hypothetical protein